MPQRPFTAELQARPLRSARPAQPSEGPSFDGPSSDGPSFDGAAILESLGRLEERLGELAKGMADFRHTGAPPSSDGERAAETRRELASLSGQGEGETDRVEAAEQELAAIVEATETATQTILEATEDIERVLGDVAVNAGPVVAEQLTEASDAVVRIYQASTFQDITGQRIAKVVRTLAFIDARLTALSDLWRDGADGNDGPATAPTEGEKPEERQAPGALPAAEGWDDAHLLNGPQLENQGISQAEIDKLFD